MLVCGLITSVCVQHSAFGVFEAGYRTLLVEDACGDRGKARHDAALALYGGYMYELISSKELADPVNGMHMAKAVWITVDDVRGGNNTRPRDRSGSVSVVCVDTSTSTSNKKRKISMYEEEKGDCGNGNGNGNDKRNSNTKTAISSMVVVVASECTTSASSSSNIVEVAD